jgi:hypothetical protein
MYILDSDFLIHAYRYDFPPGPNDNGFWEWLDDIGKKHGIVIPEKVYEEIGKGTDGLADFLGGLHNIKKELIGSATPHLPTVLETYGDLSDKDLEIINGRADPYLVAHGIELGGIVVTNEVPRPNRTKPIEKKVPDICSLIGVQCIRYPRFLWEMQRNP